MSIASKSMRAYRVVWLIVCAAFALVGVCVAFHASPTYLVLLSVGSAVAATIWSHLVVGYRDQPWRARERSVLVAALGGATLGGSFVGFAVVLGVGAVLVAIAVIGTSPVALRACGRWLRAVWTSSRARFEAAGDALASAGLGFVPARSGDHLCLLTDEQLCDAWRSSTIALRVCSPQRLKPVVEERQRYLDEFERRNPVGFTVWLASGDPTSCDPGTQRVERGADVPAVDWDELTRGQGA